MNHQKILITGNNGQLGRALTEHYSTAQSYDSKQLDISSQEDLSKIAWDKLDVIINAAAYTNVDYAETNEGRQLAWRINANGTRNLANLALKHSLTLVHISTDYVFDGTIKPHDEEEALSPINVYGQSKAAGDIAVSLVEKHYSLRTSWLIGNGKNFVQTMLELAQKKIEPKIVSDQIGRLTFTNELVRVIDYLLANRPAYGTYNVSNSGPEISWSDLTRLIFKLSGHNLKVYDTTTEEYFKDKPNSANRPLNSVFDLTKITSTGFISNDWQIELKNYIKERISN